MCFEKVLLLVVCCILRQVRAISRAHSKLKIGQRALLLSPAVLNSKCWLCPAAVNCSSNVFRFHCKDQGQLSFLGNFSFNDEDESAEKENLLLQTFKDDLLVFCAS